MVRVKGVQQRNLYRMLKSYGMEGSFVRSMSCPDLTHSRARLQVVDAFYALFTKCRFSIGYMWIKNHVVSSFECFETSRQMLQKGPLKAADSWQVCVFFLKFNKYPWAVFSRFCPS